MERVFSLRLRGRHMISIPQPKVYQINIEGLRDLVMLWATQIELTLLVITFTGGTARGSLNSIIIPEKS